jgi:L-ascorbate metabolism protein UlaG (beta-lactamase superfamily)
LSLSRNAGEGAERSEAGEGRGAPRTLTRPLLPQRPPSPAVRERSFSDRSGPCRIFATVVAACVLALALLAPFIASPARAACIGAVAEGRAPLRLVAAKPEGAVGITFLGHASFLLESPGGVRIVTDYNDLIRAPMVPDIVTMNNAHSTHYTDVIEPGVKFVLRGWGATNHGANHQLEYRDVRIHNVPTNVREFGGTRYNGNSIFVFEMADLCIAHLGHLHHTLTQTHLAELGPVDVVMVPVDGSYTLNQEEMLSVLQQIKPALVLPMHIFSRATLDRFLARVGDLYKLRWSDEPSLTLTRADLPKDPEVRVLPGR